MGRIPEETIEQVIAGTDIVDLISSYVPLKRAGSIFKANCPFHNEKTPSFTVNPSYQNFKCFGCQEGGSAIGFVMKYENLQFIDAVKKLAQRANIPIIEENLDPESEKRRHRSTRLKELHNKAARYFHSLLLGSTDAQHARDYVKSRGFSKETAEKWLIGWAPANSKDFLTWAKKEGFTGRELADSGICGQRDENNPRAGLFVRFFDRLMFPVHNDYGDVVAFSARQLRDDPRSGKYINSPETAIFQKSKILFALDKARKAMSKEKFALLCEGQLDVIACHEAGLEHTVAGLGTAFTEDHARLLKRYTDNVIICYDGDSAGLSAADKAYRQLATVGFPVRLAHLPDGEDPDTFLQKNGPEALRELLNNAQDFFEARLDRDVKTHDLNNPVEIANLINNLANLVAHISDDLIRDTVIQNIAVRLRRGSDVIRTNVHQAQVKLKREKSRSKRFEQKNEPATTIEPAPIDPSIAYLCHLSLTSSEAADLLCEQLEALHEVLDTTMGGHILRRILARRPDPKNSAAILAFLSTFPESEQRALTLTFTSDTPTDPAQACTESVNLILSTHFQKKEASLRAALNDPKLDNVQMISLLEEIKEIQEFLKNLSSRFIR